MLTSLSIESLTGSVLAVPPLARNADLSLNETENRKLIRHIEAGGVRTLLYGGNANFYHVSLAEYDTILGFLAFAAGPDTLVIPSAGPPRGTRVGPARGARGPRVRDDDGPGAGAPAAPVPDGHGPAAGRHHDVGGRGGRDRTVRAGGGR